MVVSSIIEAKSKNQLVEAGVDLMFANALRYLYVDVEITDEGLETGLSYLEDYHADKTRKAIEADLTQ